MSRPGSDVHTLNATLATRSPLDSGLENIENVDPPVEIGRSRAVVNLPLTSREPLEVAVSREGIDTAEDRSVVRVGLNPAQPVDWLLPSGNVVGGGLEGRSPEGRAAMLTRFGHPVDEPAVERGLQWLVAHQLEDGSWNFDHRKSACAGLCRNPGNEASTTGATGLTLLAFLGAGYTHTTGEYQRAVKRGLYYLGSRALVTPNGVDLQEGTMYAQALAALALCEAYAMTGDPALEDLAQQAIDFILYAQDAEGGGWRYAPGEPGDTTVTGWQLMALKSAETAGIRVASPRFFLTQRFLDSVQSEEGARYGYMDRDPRNTTTAIGLLCRMFTGWRRGRPALARGVAYLCEWGPSEDDIYYNYYATQVLFHWEGSDWSRWDRQMRAHLLATQAQSGHESGSWYFKRHGQAGGRLYSTAMAVMTLEVYYRYMPLYSEVPLD